jgi:hypothetical protein
LTNDGERRINELTGGVCKAFFAVRVKYVFHVKVSLLLSTLSPMHYGKKRLLDLLSIFSVRIYVLPRTYCVLFKLCQTYQLKHLFYTSYPEKKELKYIVLKFKFDENFVCLKYQTQVQMQ